MTYESCVGVAVENVTVLSWMIFSCTGDRLAQNVSSYVKLQEYVEVYNGVWSVRVCIGIVCDRDCPYNILCCTLQAELSLIP